MSGLRPSPASPMTLELFSAPNVATIGTLLIGVTWLLCAWVTSTIAHHKGDPRFKWFALGLVLGPFSWVAAHYGGKLCAHCRKRIHRQALICPWRQRPQTYKTRDAGSARPQPESLIVDNQ
jgi:hypothetical protein